MWAKPGDIELQTERLLRVLEPPIFRFVLVQAMPPDAVARYFSNILKERFPGRPLLRVKIEKQDYAALMREIESAETGFVLLENFQNLLLNPDLHVGFNQRRDRIASRPIALIAFLPTGQEAARMVQDRLPDFWSFRAFTMQVYCKYVPGLYPVYQPEFREPVFELNFEEKKAEIARLQKLLEQSSPETDAYLRANRLTQLAAHFVDLFWRKEADAALDEALVLLRSLPEDGSTLALTFDALYLKAVSQKDHEEFDEALETLKIAQKLAEKESDWERVVKSQNLRTAVKAAAGDLISVEIFSGEALSNSIVHLQPTDFQFIIAEVQRSEALWRISRLDEARELIDSAWKKRAALSFDKKSKAHLFVLNNYYRFWRTAPFESYHHPIFTELQTGQFELGNQYAGSPGGRAITAKRNVEHAYGPEHPLIVECLLLRIWSLYNEHFQHLKGNWSWNWQRARRKNLATATQNLEEARAILQKHFRPTSPKFLPLELAMSHFQVEFEHWQKAETTLRDLLEKLAAQPQQNPLMTAKCCYLLSFVLSKTMRWEEAKTWAEKSRVLLDQMLVLENNQEENLLAKQELRILQWFSRSKPEQWVRKTFGRRANWQESLPYFLLLLVRLSFSVGLIWLIYRLIRWVFSLIF